VDEITRLATEKYLLVTTFRRDGRAVPTPVWAARDGDSLVVWSASDAGKVKRIRRDGAVRLAPCTVRGAPTGPEVAGLAELLDADESERVRGLIASRYGLLGRVTMLGSRLRRGPTGTVGIRLTVPAQSEAQAEARPADPA
jgi:PPOX class probable F420-dependent enzyme